MMNRLRLEKAQATKAANRERMRSQTVTVDDHWRIVRADPMNWEIQFKTAKGWQFQGYYGTIVAALKVLPAKMLGESAKGTLNDLLRNVEGIRESIEKAI